jgi:hypothetical protein
MPHWAIEISGRNNAAAAIMARITGNRFIDDSFPNIVFRIIVDSKNMPIIDDAGSKT